MSRKSHLAVALLLFVAACGDQDEIAEPKGDDFALSLKIEAEGAKVQRIDLPAAALVAIKRPDKGDIRVVDAHYRPLSMAFIDLDAGRENKLELHAIPFDGSKGKNTATPVSVRVEQDGSSVSVQSGRGGPADEAGVLFDTRNVKEPAVGIALEVEVPKQRPVAISIEAGNDLKSWEPLAEHVLLRLGDGPELLGGNRIALPGADLRERYLRVTWQDKPQLRIKVATLVTSSIPRPRPVAVSTKGLKLSDAHGLTFTMPSGVMPTAMRVTMTGRDGVIPVRLLGRDNLEAPWTPLSIASLRQGGAAVLLEIGERPLHLLKLEADPRSAGFSQVPKVEFQYTPVALAVAFNGAGPYRLLVGNSSAKPTSFALKDLTNASQGLEEAKIIGAQPDVSVELAESGHDTRFTPRSTALWSVLLGGVALLVYAAIKLMRINNAA